MLFPYLSIAELGDKRAGHPRTCPCPYDRALAERFMIVQEDPSRLGRRDLWSIVRRHEVGCDCRACLRWKWLWIMIHAETKAKALAS